MKVGILFVKSEEFMNFQKVSDPFFIEEEKPSHIEQKLLQAERALQGKSAALSEVLSHLEEQKRLIQEQVIDNVHKLILPALQKLQRKANPEQQKYIDLIQSNLQSLLDSFGNNLRVKFSNLTAKEIEVCNMIRNDYTGAQIRKALNISLPTLETHRSRIRKKLGICNQQINLTSYLKTL